MIPLRFLSTLGVACLLLSTTLRADDLVEFLSGVKMSGTVTEIRKDAKEFDFEAMIGTRSVFQTYPFSKVHAVTYQGNRFVLTPMQSEDQADKRSATNIKRSTSDINQLIEQAGATMPDWLESTQLNYPATLDLSWPLKPEGSWNSRKNVGQFIWDVINPNPSRWQSGIKLVHHCMTLHEDQPELLKRDQQTLGRMYFDLLQDYPRAAYWLRKSGVQ
jgi:hypothetical protein